jgi:hypothetical protein
MGAAPALASTRLSGVAEPKSSTQSGSAPVRVGHGFGLGAHAVSSQSTLSEVSQGLVRSERMGSPPWAGVWR